MSQLILFCDNRLSKSVSALPYKVYVLAYCIYTNLNMHQHCHNGLFLV